MMLLTLVVWVYMYARRLGFLRGQRIDLRTVDTPVKADAVIPANVHLASHNLRNLFELPVIFYALCLYLYASDSVDRTHLATAWCFLAFRMLHSLIHCSYNDVRHRFFAYAVAAIALWTMVIRTVVESAAA